MTTTVHGAPLLLWIVLGAIALELLLCYVILPGVSYLRSRMQPVCRVPARVLLAHQRTLTDASTLVAILGTVWSSFGRRRLWPRDDDDGSFYRTLAFFLTFETDNNRRLEFRVSEAQFGQQAQDDIGLLVYQGGRFLEFRREKEVGEPQM